MWSCDCYRCKTVRAFPMLACPAVEGCRCALCVEARVDNKITDLEEEIGDLENQIIYLGNRIDEAKEILRRLNDGKTA